MSYSGIDRLRESNFSDDELKREFYHKEPVAFAKNADSGIIRSSENNLSRSCELWEMAGRIIFQGLGLDAVLQIFLQQCRTLNGIDG